MVDILHRIGTRTQSPEPVYRALTEVEGLAGWWTADTEGSGMPGGNLRFRFPPLDGFDMEVVEAVPDKRVVWRVVNGPEEWIGTTVEWDLRQDGDWTIVLFAHRGWREPVEFLQHCSTKWATFLVSLKALVETGRGTPAPHDVPISEWH